MKYQIQKEQRRRRKKRRRERKKRFKKPIPRIVVPSFFTLMNLFCGFMAIVYVADGRLAFGAWLIVFSGLFDALDGFMARLSNATSEFGIQLDSIADVVSFGVAPGFLVYHFGLSEMQLPGIILSSLPPLCGAVRLARFNVEAHETKLEYFRGLPIPAQALMIVGFYLTFQGRLDLFGDFKYGVNSVLIPIIILLSFLMVSTVPFDKIPRFDKGTMKRRKGRLLLFLGYLAAIILLQEYGLMIVFTIFIIKGLALSGLQFWREAFSDDDDFEDEDDDEFVIIDDMPKGG